VITIFLIVFIVFTISRSAGDPVAAYVTPDTPKEIIEVIRKKYHLDESIPVQFIYWLNGVAHGDWGRAYGLGRRPVADLIERYLPLTLELNLYVFVIALPLSYWIATKAATHKDTSIDHAARVLSLIGQCFPQFFIGILFLAFLYRRDWIVIDPSWAFQKITGMPTVDAILNGDLEGFVVALKYLIGPLVVLTIASLSMSMRILRSSILEELSKDYIMTGRSKGLSKDYVEKRYARRNALIPFVTLMGFWVANLISGSAIVEVVFNRYGLGNIMAMAARSTDHNTIQALTVIYTIALIFTNFIVDIVYGFIDPRIKYGEKR